MTHSDHVRLLQKGIQKRGGVWADFGSGEGAFTLALAEIIGKKGMIYSIDKNEDSLAAQLDAFTQYFPEHDITYLQKDFTRPLTLPPLDGIVAANSLHFLRNKTLVFGLMKNYLKRGGKILIVEYNVDRGNMWVPYPFSYATFCKITAEVGLKKPQQLAIIPSYFLQQIYSAVVYK